MNVYTFTCHTILVILGMMGLSAAVIFFLRLIEFRRSHVDYADFLHGIENNLTKGNTEEALILCDETMAPVARVVGAAIRRQHDAARTLRDAVDVAGRAEVNRLSRRLTALAMIAQLSPLLGLIGTFAGLGRVLLAADADVLVLRTDISGAIGGALLTALAGLFISVPAHVMYAVLRTRLERLIAELESAASGILAIIASQREKVS